MECKRMKTLGNDGKALWTDLHERFDVAGAEALVAQLCTLQDRLGEIRAALASEGLASSAGRKLLSLELRTVAEFSRAWRLLGLADMPAAERRPPGRPVVERIRR